MMVRKTTVRQHTRRVNGQRVPVMRHERRLQPVNMGRVGKPSLLTRKEKVRRAAEEFRNRIETQKGIKGALFLEIINRGEGEYTFRVRSRQHGVLEEMDYPVKTFFEQQSPAYQASVKAEERYYDTADSRYEKNRRGRKVLHEGHDADLVEETPTRREWVSRVTGEIERERFNDREGRWEMI